MIASLGAVGGRRGLRLGRSGRRRDLQATSRSIPKARLQARAGCGRRPSTAAYAQPRCPAPGARSSPNVRRAHPCARRLPGSRCPERRRHSDRLPGRTRGRPPSPGRPGRNGGFGPGRQVATRSDCSTPPREHPRSRKPTSETGPTEPDASAGQTINPSRPRNEARSAGRGLAGPRRQGPRLRLASPSAHRLHRHRPQAVRRPRRRSSP